VYILLIRLIGRLVGQKAVNGYEERKRFMRKTTITRRESLLALGAAGAGLLAWSAGERPADARTANPSRKRALRIAHLTDIHVEPELRAGEGLAACLRHVQGLADPPDLILTGGDSVMDSFEADDARTALQWDLWHRVFRDECSIPRRSCIGNHDVWGWAKSKSHTTGDEPNWGKKRAVEMLRLEERHYAFSQAGWKVLVLDSTQPLPDGREGYTAHLDEPQFDWLARTLRDTPAGTPMMLVSHIPILSATAVLWARTVSGGQMHTDRVRLKDLFARHPNVRLCLSGHMHLVDRVDYNGVTYLCNGAVSGAWWKGRHKDCDEGYGLVDLYDDGSFDHRYVPYGWKAVG
jgi:3',5'-cyclic AMP phosphodiesterase CpdA